MQINTHVLKIENELFPVYHVERRLYKFQNWKDAREKLIKILTKQFKEDFKLETAYIEFLMANPMRKSRLGNFYISIKAKVFLDGKYVGNEDTLNFEEIPVSEFEILDQEEKEIMEERSFDSDKYKSVLYDKEFERRFDERRDRAEKSLFGGLPFIGFNESKVKSEITFDMDKEGWRPSMDNRRLFRQSRITS